MEPLTSLYPLKAAEPQYPRRRAETKKKKKFSDAFRRHLKTQDGPLGVNLIKISCLN